MSSCPRCGVEDPFCTIMSRFNTDIICCACEDIERLHPAYAAAAEAERQAVKAGYRNFPGVGAPPDIVAFTRQKRGLV